MTVKKNHVGSAAHEIIVYKHKQTERQTDRHTINYIIKSGKVMNGDGHRKNSVESTTSTNSSVDATNKKKDENGDAKDKLEVKRGNSNNILLKIFQLKIIRD